MDFRRFDLNLLLVLDALFEEGSATAAASRLKISQPTVSFSLAKLRDQFNDPLFVRTRAGLVPTAFASRLRESVREAIDLIEHRVLLAAEFDPMTSKRVFQISTSDVGELCFLPDLIEALRQRAPSVTLTSVSLAPDELERAFQAGTVDLAAGYFPDLGPPNIVSEILFEHPFVVIARRGHPVSASPLTLERFLAAEHAVVVAKGRSQEMFERTMAQRGLERRIALSTPHFMSLPFLIARSDLIATVPRAVGTAYAAGLGLELMALPIDQPPIIIAQHWFQRHAHDPAIIWLRNLMSELFLNRDPTQP